MSDEQHHGAARSTDPDTSQAAAEEVDASALEAIVYGAIRRHHNLINHEIEHITGICFESVTPRMVALEEGGFIVRTEDRRRPLECYVGSPVPPYYKTGIVWRLRHPDEPKTSPPARKPRKPRGVTISIMEAEWW